jgi:hypothetical protein
MVKINTFFAEWWSGPTSADWQGQITVLQIDVHVARSAMLGHNQGTSLRNKVGFITPISELILNMIGRSSDGDQMSIHQLSSPEVIPLLGHQNMGLSTLMCHNQMDRMKA